MAIIIKTLVLTLAILYSGSFITKTIKRRVNGWHMLISLILWVIFYLLEKLWV